MRKYLTLLATLQTLGSGFAPPQLIVNEDSDHPAVPRTQKDGISDLQHLVLNSEKEDAWAFIPATQEWHDVGMHSYLLEGQATGVRLDRFKIYDLARENSVLVLYHLHPKPAIIKVLQPQLDALSGGSITPDQVIEYAMINATLPSADDLASAVQLHCYIDSQTETRHRVASLYGITEYQLHVKKKSLFCGESDDHSPLLSARAIAQEVLRKVRHDDVKQKVHRALRGKKKINLFHGQYFTITFTPYAAVR